MHSQFFGSYEVQYCPWQSDFVKACMPAAIVYPDDDQTIHTSFAMLPGTKTNSPAPSTALVPRSLTCHLILL